MKACAVISALALLGLIGCGPKEEVPEPMGDAAPAFSGDMKTFMVGSWSPIEGGSVNLNKRWIFSGDGTFIFHTEDPWRAAGKWEVADNRVTLQYLTLDGLAWNDAHAKVQQEESGGGQAAIATALGMRWVFEDLPKMAWIILDDDKKHMKFANPAAEEPEPTQDQNPSGGMSDPNLPQDESFSLDDVMSIQIERLK